MGRYQGLNVPEKTVTADPAGSERQMNMARRAVHER
jgi:hypothetical protein